MADAVDTTDVFVVTCFQQGPHEEAIGGESFYAEMQGTRSPASDVRTKSTHLLQGALKLLPIVDSVYYFSLKNNVVALVTLEGGGQGGEGRREG